MPEETELRPTPEMDAVIAADSGGGDFIKALADKGKQLERERDRLLTELKKAVSAHAFDAAWKPAARAAIAEVEGRH